MSLVPAPVLLVEDNEDDSILIPFAFENAGIMCQFHFVADGEEAIAYLSGEGKFQDRNQYPLPVVALIDLSLPKKTGHDVLAWLQKQPDLKTLVRMVLTGSERPEDISRAYRLGADGYLRKPLTVEQLTGPGRNLRTLLMGSHVQPEMRIAA